MEHSRRTIMNHLSLTANFPTGRRDQSRSPPRQAFPDDSRGRDSRYQDGEMRHERDYDGRHGRGDEEYSKRGGSSRGTRHHARDEHDYGGMYDDGYQREGDYGHDRYGDESYQRERSAYRDSDDRRSRSRSGSRHNRSGSHSPTREAGKPSDTVILEGLPYNVSSSELRDSLLQFSVATDFPSIDVRVTASKGHCRAFVQFQEVDHAVVFMREHYPKLYLELAHSTDDVPDGKFEAYIHYARSRESREDIDPRVAGGSNWNCPTCDFSNYSTRIKCKICGGPQAASNWQQNLTGVTDAANVPSQILVVYPLAPFVNEDMFVNDIKKLEVEKADSTKDNSNGAPKLKSTAPTGNTSGYGARPGSLHRVFLMRDTHTNESFKYGFVEFWTLEDAAAAVAKFQKSRSFMVAACPVTVSTIHMGVFVPEERQVTPGIEHMSFNPLFNPSLRVRYRDLHVYPREKIVTPSPPNGGDAAKADADEANDGKKSKKRKAEGTSAGNATKKLVPMAGQMAMWQRKRGELRGDDRGSSDNGLQNAEGDGQDRVPVRISLSGNGLTDTKPQGPIKISLSGGTKLGAPQDSGARKCTTPEPAAASDNKAQVPLDWSNTAVSYVDRDRLMCLICMRKYKSVDEVNIHEKSRNHKTATENEDQVKAALPRLATRDKRLQKQAEENPEAAPAASQYRDRAKERRQQEESAQPAKPAQSKGAGMLAKMGWSAGAGLGANGDGRTDAIATNAYQEGVGLGAEGGNLGDAAQLAERKTKNSYTDYLNTVQDKARERYNKMG
ncbi:hypothetical protein B0J13DRAFT_543790 [Dactylonectria estremocensis]|uniref:RNA-binding protein n=1 Tax=Dactylonectria estremocensis TaxID=1079267 RepID=A0A9P9FD52_9HYPO|nr:hypothetical protein B0J13DRAFT_543790 [Dactylonectria estremocensis]